MDKAYRIKVKMDQLDYPVWRTVVIPGYYLLDDLARALKTMFSWPESVSCAFYEADSPWPEANLEVISDQSLQICELLQVEVPIFTVGNEQWRHKLLLEEVMETCTKLPYPRCIGGEGHRPPLDIGGPEGYLSFLEAVENNSHPEHYEWLEWAEKDTNGRMFDKKYFYILEVNRKLKQMKRD